MTENRERCPATDRFAQIESFAHRGYSLLEYLIIRGFMLYLLVKGLLALVDP